MTEEYYEKQDWDGDPEPYTEKELERLYELTKDGEIDG